jgi:hypothetical protein
MTVFLRSVLRLLITVNDIGFEVSTVVTMKNAVFLNVTPYGSCRNRGLLYRPPPPVTGTALLFICR